MLMILLGLASCADSGQFSKSSIKHAEAPQVADATPETPDVVESSPEAPEELAAEPAEEYTALDECLNTWENHPFSLEEIKNPTLANIDQNKGNGDLIYSDPTATELPALYLVTIGLNVANKGMMELRNPNGWYCLYFTGRIANNFQILMGQESMLATVSQETQTANNFKVIRQ
ncbi:hypothetical protein [Pseudobacteriovorax antillogorgiicola]|nr:hypothetical protein [Pseudobacteriovorax antillogorgiicola]